MHWELEHDQMVLLWHITYCLFFVFIKCISCDWKGDSTCFELVRRTQTGSQKTMPNYDSLAQITSLTHSNRCLVLIDKYKICWKPKHKKMCQSANITTKISVSKPCAQNCLHWQNNLNWITQPLSMREPVGSKQISYFVNAVENCVWVLVVILFISLVFLYSSTGMNRLKRSLSLRSSKRHIPESVRPQIWENDSYKVRNGGVSFPVKVG